MMALWYVTYCRTIALDTQSVPDDVEVTHLNLYDGTIEGPRRPRKPVSRKVSAASGVGG